MSFQNKSNKKYLSLIKNKKKSLTEISGRYPEDKGTEKFILIDIEKKLLLKKSDKLLDIGCGYSELLKKTIKLSERLKIELTLCDIKNVIAAIKSNIKVRSNVKFIDKHFQNYNFDKKRYNKILLYSVIHYIDKPKVFLNKAFNLLERKGSMLIGDIPNVDKKFRFLKSPFGKKFEKKRKKRFDINKLTKNYYSFLKYTKQNTNINDSFVKWIKTHFKKKKAKVVIFNQSKKLPYCYTRQDILIRK